LSMVEGLTAAMKTTGSAEASSDNANDNASKSAKVSKYLMFTPSYQFLIGFNAYLSFYLLEVSSSPYDVMDT